MLYTRVKEHNEHLKKLGYNVAATFLQGSQNYNLDHEGSDVDTKSIIIPTLDELIRGTKPTSKVIIMDNGEHAEIKDIRLMAKMWEKQNPTYLEILFTKYRIINNDRVKLLLGMRHEITNINNNALLRCIKGMSHEKLKNIERDTPKQMHHISRLNLMVSLYRVTKFGDCFEFDRETREHLLNVKLGKETIDAELTDKYTKEMCESMMREVDVINEKTIGIMNEIIYDIIRREILCT